MATIKFSDLRRTLVEHQTALDKQLEATKKKLRDASDAGNQDEVRRLTGELETRVRAKAALDGIVSVSSLMCCDQFFDCPDP
jgi:hypothetical protein